MYEKECEICGKFFSTPTRIRKYCDDCLAHQKRNMGDVYHAQRRAATYWHENVISLTCDLCGKEFKTIPRLLFRATSVRSLDDRSHVFCTKKCRDEFLTANARCYRCGKPIPGKEGYDPDDWHTWFCSEECRHADYIEKARRNGWLRTCTECGKQFVKKKKTDFCSRECYRKAVEHGWKPPVPEGEKNATTVMRNCTCVICGKRWTAVIPISKAGDYPLCSERCRDIYEAEERERMEARRRKLKKGNSRNSGKHGHPVT